MQAMTLLFVDQLTVIDFSYFHIDRGIVGESWILDVTLGGSLDENGMVFDFAHVKKQIKQQVDNVLDHKFAFPMLYKDASITVSNDSLTIDTRNSKGQQYIHHSPTQAVAQIQCDSISKMSVLNFLKDEVRKVVPENVTSIELNLRTESINGDYYHYSHGLKKTFW